MDCCSAPGLTPLDQALTQLLNEIQPITDKELVDLDESLGRIIADPVVSSLNIPPADNSAMDGYALKAADGAEGTQLKMVAKVFAGHPYTGELNSGECVRIMTGAQVPPCADSVVMQENVLAEGENEELITLKQQVTFAAHVRKAGEDIKVGQEILVPGRRIRATDIGLLSSLGVAKVSVYRQLKVALISTGDELKAPGETLEPGQFYESNGYTVAAVLKKFGAEVIDFGILPDDIEVLKKAFIDADQQADVVVTSGGVSVGEADHVKPILEELGRIAFWKLAIKPGKPFAFGHLPNSYFIGLPGNPVSALVTMHKLTVPMLRKLSGAEAESALRIPATSGTKIKKGPGRTDFQRGIYSINAEGGFDVVTTGSQGSGILRSMSMANCYIVLEQERGNVEPGEAVVIEPFDQMLS